MKPKREILLKDKELLAAVANFRNRFRSLRDAAHERAGSVAWHDFTLDLFRFQAEANPVYRRFIELMELNPASVSAIDEIPFLPVELYQTQRVSVFPSSAHDAHTFASSGTTGSSPSQHHIDDLEWYNDVSASGFEHLVCGWSQRPHFVGLLPGYLERNNSSLVHMVQYFMQKTGQKAPEDWFFLRDFEALERQLHRLWQNDEPSIRPIYIVGVTHALLSWVDRLKRQKDSPAWLGLPIHVIETGGMKGQGKERIRAELHDALSFLTQGRPVGSEYGMTELLSQAWSDGEGIFQCPPWMEVRMGSLNDPKSWAEEGRQGRIHIIDLANVSTCAFLATSDIGRRLEGGAFEVLGRYDHAEVRGCNLMAID